MRLKTAHRILIGTAVGLFALLTVRWIVHFARAREPQLLLSAALSAAAALALFVYYRTLRSKKLP